MHLSGIGDLRNLSKDVNGCRLIADSFINHLENTPNALNPWVCTNQDVDLLTLNLFENKNKPLSGLILGVKDVIATEEFPTKMGSGENWENPNMGFDARIVSEAKNLGAVIGGKTKSSEFAVHKETNVVNPHYHGRTSGTSSSGSAAAVANGSVCISLATQTAGSIARPASYCSVLAMKPTFGDYPRTGILKTTDEFDTVGFFGKSLSHIAEFYFATRLKGLNYPVNEKRRSIKEFNSFILAVGDNFDRASNQLRNKAKQFALKYIDKFSTINFPLALFEIRDIHSKIYKDNLSYYFQQEIKDNRVSSEFSSFVESKQDTDQKKVKDHLKQLQNWREQFNDFVGDSLIISLGANSSAPLKDPTYDFDMNLLITAAGYSQIVVPNLIKDEDGKNVSISFSARKGFDENLINFLFSNLLLD